MTSFKDNVENMKSYKVSRNGTILGEYDQSSISQFVAAGSLTTSDHGWTQGMTEWKSLGELGFSPPPLPSKSKSSQQLNTSQQAANSSGSSAATIWIFVAIFFPIIGCWRVIFDKTLGYTPTTKKIFIAWLTIYFVALTFGLIAAINQKGPDEASDEYLREMAERINQGMERKRKR